MNKCPCQEKRELWLKAIELVPVSSMKEDVYQVGRDGVMSIKDLDGDMRVQMQPVKERVTGDSDVMIWVPQWIVIPAAQIRRIYFEGEWPEQQQQIEIKIDPLHGGEDVVG